MNTDGTLFSFLPGVDASHVCVRALALGCFYSHISIGTFRRALTASVDSCAEIKSALQWRNQIWEEFGGRCRKAMLGVCVRAKLQALVYDILPSTTAVFSYAIGSRKLSANEQIFVGAQTVVSLLQTT